MTNDRFYCPAGTTARGEYTTYVDPETAGWDYSSLRVLELDAGDEHELATGDSEWIVLPLSGGCTVTCDGETFELAGRTSVFHGVTDFAYVPRDAQVRITSAAGGRFALTGARCENRLPSATARPPGCRSSCAAPGRPAARSTTSARRTCSRPTG